jgi:translation initiation factor IF-1
MMATPAPACRRASSKEYANMNCSAVTAILAATLVLPVVALADQGGHGPEQLNHGGTGFPGRVSNQRPLTHEQTSVVRGTVLASDTKTRLVTLKTEDGRTLDVPISDRVKNFDKIAVGDVVEATYTESVVFRIVPKGKTVGQKVTSSFEIASVDPTANILWVTLPNGTTKPINFDEKSQRRLMALSPGDVVSATYTESAAIQLEKLAR